MDKEQQQIIYNKITNSFWFPVFSTAVNTVFHIIYGTIYFCIKGFICWGFWGVFFTDIIPQPSPLTVIGMCFILYLATNNGRVKHKFESVEELILSDASFLFTALIIGFLLGLN